MTRRTKLLLGGMAGLLGLVVLFLVEERIRGQLSLAAWKRAMAARGERLEFVALDPVIAVPGARICQPRQLLTLPGMPGGGGLKEPTAPWRLPPGKEAVIWRSLEWANSDQAKFNYRLFASRVRGPRASLPKVRAWLTNGPVVVQLDYTQDPNPQVFHLRALRDLGRLLRWATLLALEDEDRDQALQNLLASRALLETLRHEAVLVSQLARLALGELAVGTVWQALEAEGWTDAQLAALQTVWQEPQFLTGVVDGLRLARATYLDRHAQGRPTRSEICASLEWNPPWNAGVADGSLIENSPVFGWLAPLHRPAAPFRRAAFAELWRFAWSSQDAAFYARSVQAAVDAARTAVADRDARAFLPGRPRTGPARAPVPPIRNLADLNGYDRLRGWHAAMSLSSTDRVLEKAAGMEAYAELARTAIALKRYRLRHGEWPTNLAALVPAFTATPPRDWMDGQPLRYRRNDDGSFTLYSVGADGRDDGGDARPPEGGGRSILQGRDWVWPQPATDADLRAAQAGWFGQGNP